MEPRAFVVMPFGVKEVRPGVAADGTAPAQAPLTVSFDEVYTLLIAPALRATGCRPVRADHEPGAGDIRTDMYYELVTADVVLADISIHNANVFYELGVRHGVAERGIFTVHGGWSRKPFDIAPDRCFAYKGQLFESSQPRDAMWREHVDAAVAELAGRLRAALAADRQSIGSPIYKEMRGLKPVDWSGVQDAGAKYFGSAFVNWQARARLAAAKGYPGDILTLADDAPTSYHRCRLLWEAAGPLNARRRFDLAQAVLEEIVALEPDNLDALCQLELVYEQRGKLTEAREHMTRVAARYAAAPQAQFMAGKMQEALWHLQWRHLSSPEERRRIAALRADHLVQALQCYYAAFRQHIASYRNGVHVLALARRLDFLEQTTGRSIARPTIPDLPDIEIVTRLAATGALEQARQADQPEEVAWALGGLAGLAWLREDFAATAALYEQAAHTAGVTRFQLELFLDYLRVYEELGQYPEAVPGILQALRESMDCLAPPVPQFRKVVLFSGHMIDTPERHEPRFPGIKEDAVRERLAAQLEEWEIGADDVALCGAACGGDILFAELCAARGARVRLCIALPEPEFLASSVRRGGRSATGATWEDRYFALRERAGVETWFQHERLGPPPQGVAVHARNNDWMMHTARVESTGRNLYVALVWDGRTTPDKRGGTGDFADSVRTLGGRAGEIINPLLV